MKVGEAMTREVKIADPDWSIRDAAKAMHVPVGTVKSRLHSAIQRLGQAWRDWQPANRS